MSLNWFKTALKLCQPYALSTRDFDRWWIMWNCILHSVANLYMVSRLVVISPWNRGVSIHKVVCPDYFRMTTQEPERAVEADWEMQVTCGQSVQIVVEAYDRRGLLRAIPTQVIFLRSNQYVRSIRFLRQMGLPI